MSDRSTPLPPAEAAKTFTVPDDLEIEQVLAEPLIAQPVFLNFDERGRMWVVQYRQYPAPAGLNVVSRDKFWRAVYDKVPEPPPRGVKGLDRISVHEDTDGDGAYDKHKVFVDGLNIATSCAKGRGGVWVLNPPYLLFYPDKNDDDVPDGDAEVHLEGFGLEDTHSVVNSLRWGPDGWLYAAQGSTVTANVRVRSGRRGTNGVVEYWSNERVAAATLQHSITPSLQSLRYSTRPGEPPVYSQGQNIWRYHPERRIYEIFAEGGGNAFGVEFDDKGRLFSGHNGGDTRGFHYMQGAYLRKGFEKHGELSNPYAFGYFPHMEGTKGERFSHTFIIYHGGALPPRYEGKLFGVEPLQGRIVLSEITPDGSTFKTRDLERVVTSSDSWFRPVDIKAGPDGAIYIADWYDRQVTHTRNQEGNIDTSNGRIYRLKKKGAKASKIIDLSAESDDKLLILAAAASDWRRGPALRLLAERKNPTIAGRFMNFLRLAKQQAIAEVQDPNAWRMGPDPKTLSLGSLWGLHLTELYSAGESGRDTGIISTRATELLLHTDPNVRLWTIRFLGDDHASSGSLSASIASLANSETNLEVRAQLACTAKRLPAAEALPIVRNLILSSTRSIRRQPDHSKSAADQIRLTPDATVQEDDARDPRLPLLIWWAIESKCESDRDAVVKLFEDSPLWTRPIVEEHILKRLMRRFAAAGTRKDLLTCARLLDLSPTRAHSEKLMKGFEEAFKGRSIAGLPDELIAAMARHDLGSPAFRLRRGDADAVRLALITIADPNARKAQRIEFIEVLGEVKQPRALDALLQLVLNTTDPDIVRATLSALQNFDGKIIGDWVVASYLQLPTEALPAALTLLTSRAAWSLTLVEAVDAGRLKPSDVPLETVRQLQRLGRATLPRNPDQKDSSARQEPRPSVSEKIAALLPKLWPNAGRPTTEAMQNQIQRLAGVLQVGKGDPYSGQKLFNNSCASCHALFARGGKVGPDLTTYQRGDLDAMLLHIVNPSAEIREGFENLAIETKDGRSLSGFLVERDARIVVLRGLDGQNITLDQKEIAEMNAAGMSLMPEGLLDGLTDQQARDLFAYLRSTQPLAN